MPSHRAAAAAAAVLAGALAGCVDAADDVEEAPGGSWTAALAVTADWAEAAPDATGTVDITFTGETSVELAVTGLQASTDYTAHVHDGECDATPPGGGHWLADPDGEDAAGNIIESAFTTSETGTGSTTVSSDLEPDERAKSFVLHAPAALTETEGLESDRVLCGDLEDA
ncbi:MAG TPA: hypothetical protein VHG10_10665 [Glycomyces sp.]|nr:hypothetical protein [Glycomyces sp.]